jgi:hypothetical protein
MFVFLFFAGFLRRNFKNGLHVAGNAELVILHSEGLSQRQACLDFHRTNPINPTPQHGAAYSLIEGRGSSVSIVSDYGLDDRGSIPGRGRGFFF